MNELWNRWCNLVNDHNESLNNYVFYEEMWSPYTPLIPIIISIIITMMLVAPFVCINNTSIVDGMAMMIKSSTVITISLELMLAINWFVYRKKK